MGKLIGFECNLKVLDVQNINLLQFHPIEKIIQFANNDLLVSAKIMIISINLSKVMDM